MNRIFFGLVKFGWSAAKKLLKSLGKLEPISKCPVAEIGLGVLVVDFKLRH